MRKDRGMRFEAAGWTDVGRVKETNQDSFVIKIANTNMGDMAMVAVADGMGGLMKGELASATAVRSLSVWFDEKLPLSLEATAGSVGGFERFVEGQWEGLAQDLNLRIMRYGMKERMNLGTTLTAMLVLGGRYSIVHVGDSRVYEITDEAVCQLTEDQTFVKREMDAGRMTPEEALVHPQRNVLLQCLGSSKEVKPEVTSGNLRRDATYLLCSDGFRHVLTEKELLGRLSPGALACAVEAFGGVSQADGSRPEGEPAPGVSALVASRASGAVDPPTENGPSTRFTKAVEQVLSDMVGLVMERKERDNITAVVLRAAEEVF